MESFYGATLGKMALGLKVMDQEGRNLTLTAAYVRFLPRLVMSFVVIVSQIMLFLSPDFESATKMIEIGQIQQGSLIIMIQYLLSFLILIECSFAAFTPRKRAVHDFIAGSFCVYKSQTNDNTLGKRMLAPVGRSGLAIAAGYAGLFAVLVIPAPIALILGILAIIDIRKHPDKHGMGRAVFGLIMGILFSLPLILILLIAIFPE
jgi:hypothetical protein